MHIEAGSETGSSGLRSSQVQGRRRQFPIWYVVVWVMLLPFLLRFGLSMDGLERSAVLSVYRDWRWSDVGSRLPPGSELIFEPMDERSPFEGIFKAQLQRDFRVVNAGTVARFRVFFMESEWNHQLMARIEVRAPDGSVSLWNGEAQDVGNGWLVGPWLGILLVLLGKSLGLSLVCGGLVMLAWRAHWSPLDVPGEIVRYFSVFADELMNRFRAGDWNASELGRLPIYGFFIWLVPRFVWQLMADARQSKIRRLATIVVVTTIVLEPLALWTSSLFGQWSSDASWWKVYIGSFAYRFLSIGFFLLVFLHPDVLNRPALFGQARQRFSWRLAFLVTFLPACFLAVNGWSWLTVVLGQNPGESLFRLKVFNLGVLLGAFLGSRVFALWLGTLALAITVPPTSGHWNAAHMWGLLLDGLWLGWWVSPFKLFELGHVLNLTRLQGILWLLVVWILGALLSSVGVPLGICWIGLGLATWAFAQSAWGPKPEVVTT